MNKLYLIRNPEVFQNEKYLSSCNYFEGWYFKHTKNDRGISFILGISIEDKKKKAFIQVITHQASYYIDYEIDLFTYHNEPFSIQIEKNYFSKEKIHLDIKESHQSPSIYGNIFYSENKEIKKNIFHPNIMGPFAYIPSMECHHAILSMKNSTQGYIMIDQEKMSFENGRAYIEKDWGISFPKTYIWAQGNDFQNEGASFMLSMADVPFKVLEFRGLICILIIDDKEYRFTTYNGAKQTACDLSDRSINITLQKGKYCLKVQSSYEIGHPLIAPNKGKMEKGIIESISASITVTLTYKNQRIFSDTSKNCGLEIVQ